MNHFWYNFALLLTLISLEPEIISRNKKQSAVFFLIVLVLSYQRIKKIHFIYTSSDEIKAIFVTFDLFCRITYAKSVSLLAESKS